MTLSHPPKKAVESDIDQMLNSVFTELEDILEIKHYWQSSSETGKSPIALTKRSPIQTDEFNYPPVSSVDEDSGVGIRTSPSPRHYTSAKPPLWLRNLDKIIFASSCSLLLWVLFLLQREQQFLGVTLTQLQSSINLSETETPEPPDNTAEFIGYMERALAEIDRQEALKARAEDLTPAVTPSVEVPPVSTTPKSEEETATAPSSPSQPQTASSPASSTNPQGGSETEIASLPALPPPPPPSESEAGTSTTPSQPPSPSAENNPPTESKSETTQTTTETEESSPEIERHSRLDLEEEPPLPTTEESTSTSPQSDQTLVGLLELGDHSAALVKVKGVTQRIMIGESVPESEWKLAEVSHNKAVFENGNQERAMSVGESLINN